MLTHPYLDSWISLDRTGEPQKLAHGNFHFDAGPPSWNLESRGLQRRITVELTRREATASSCGPAPAIFREVLNQLKSDASKGYETILVSKEILCLRRFVRDFRSSHSNLISCKV